MKIERFLAQRTDDWAALDSLVAKAHGRSSRLSPAEIRRLGLLYRSAAADLALARRAFPDAPGTRRLQMLVASAHGVVYAKSSGGAGVRQFVTRRFWQRVRAGGRCLAVSAGILLGCGVLGLLWGLFDPVGAAGILPAGFHVSSSPQPGGLVGIAIPARAGVATQIFTNNIQVAFEALAAGFTFGLFTAYLLAFNGAMLGVVTALMVKAGAWEQLVRLIVPHGVLEISCIVVAGSAGMQIARALVDPGELTRPAALRALVPTLADVILGVAGCLVLAGIVEGVVTAWDLPLAAALSVGLALGGGFWALVVLRGLPDPSPGGVGHSAGSAHPSSGAGSIDPSAEPAYA
jgi:uncharacterized membrane protein SpoIIM required for sporulation